MAKTKYDNTKWSVPSKRAKGYAEERKVKVHKWGQKQGKPLTDYEAGMRSGYLQCQNDHAGMYKYTKALAEGKSKSNPNMTERNFQTRIFLFATHPEREKIHRKMREEHRFLSHLCILNNENESGNRSIMRGKTLFRK